MAKQKTTGELSVSVLSSMKDILEESIDVSQASLGVLSSSLSAIQKSTQETEDLSLSVLEMSSNVSHLSKSLDFSSIESSINSLTLKVGELGTYLQDISSKIGPSKESAEKSETDSKKSIKDELTSLGLMASSLAALISVAKASPRAGANIKSTIDSIAESIQPISSKSQEISNAAMALSMVASSIQSLGMSLALSTPLYVIGSISVLAVSTFVPILASLYSRLDAKEISEGSRSIEDIGVSILVLGGSLALFSYLVTPEAMIETAFGVLAFSTVFYLIGGYAKQISEGSRSLYFSALSIASLGLGIAAFAALVQDPSVVIAVALSVTLIGGAFWLIGKGAKDIFEGSIALTFSGLSIAALGWGLSTFSSYDIGFSDILIAAFGIGVIGLSMFIAGKFASNIIIGSIAMTLATVPIILLGFAMEKFKQNEIGAEDIGVLSLALVTVGGAMALAGVVSPVLILGSIAMILAGASIHVLVSALSAFKAISWTEDDSRNLNFALSSVRGAFTGGKDADKGLLASIGGFFGSIFDSGAMIAASAAFMVASSAILTTSTALLEFKKVSWTESDSQALTSVFASIAKSFSILHDKKLQAEYGISVSPEDVREGIASLAFSGYTMSSLAQGVGAFAKLTFDEWELDESSGKLKVVRRTRLSPADLETAGVNISKVISVVGSAFAEVGRLESGESSPNSILDSVFGGGFVSSGVFALSGAGKTLSKLAQGVKDFASLSFTEFEVKDGKIVPAKVTKMSAADISLAGTNISKVISVVGSAFAEVGKLNSGETSNDGILSAIFGGGGQLVRRGVESLSYAGSTIVSLAQGVKDFASMNIVEYGVVDKDGIPTLVPISSRQMSEADLQTATMNISKVVSVVAGVFAEVGKLDAGEGSQNGILSAIFGGSLVGRGVEALSGVGENLVNIADAVPKYASLSFVKMKIQDINGTPTLVPGEVVQLSEGDLAKAGENISKILGIVANSFAYVGKMADEGSGWFADGYIQKGVDALKGVGTNLSQMVDSTLKIASMQVPIYDASGNQTGTVALTPADIERAATNIRTILSTSAMTFYMFGSEYGEGSEKHEILKSGTKILGSLGSTYASVIESFASSTDKTESIRASVESFSSVVSGFVANVLSIFDPSSDPEIEMKLLALNRFTDDIERISSNSAGFSTSASSMEKFSSSVKVFKDTMNSFDLKKLTLMDSMFNSLAHLAKIKGGIDSLSKNIKDSINEAFAKLVESIQEVKGVTEAGNVQTGNVVTAIQTLKTSEASPTTQNAASNPAITALANALSQQAASTDEVESLLSSILFELKRLNK